MFLPNQQIGLYKLIRRLGRGGFGEVWLAERRTQILTTKVAVKLPLNEQIDIETIKQEAELWEYASGHPNVLPIIEADIHDGQVLIVSEFAPDGSLGDWLDQHGKMPVERAIETTIQILDGLEFLHSRHIIHRDLKPANILLQGTTARLADFGISRALRTTVASQSQNISGTFAYMSPEALDGKRSVQTDVWSVGINLYQFLTVTLPFPQKEPSVLFSAIIMREFAPLPDSIPQSLKNVVAKALAKLPENRYASANEMREDLRRILRGEKVSNSVQFDLPDTQHSFPVKRSIPMQKSPVVSNRNAHKEVETVVRPKTKPTLKRNNPPQKSNLWIYAMIALVLVSAIGFGVYLLTNQSKQIVSNKSEVMQISPAQLNSNSLISENVNLSINSNANVTTLKPISTPDKKQLQLSINKYVAQFKGVEVPRKKVVYGDLDGDGDNDAVVNFYFSPLQGTASGLGSLAVFTNDEYGQFKFVAESDVSGAESNLNHSVELQQIKNRRILLHTLDYSEGDAQCCPSKKGRISYVLNGNKLVRMQR